MTPFIIPIFITHQGCPQRCIYCNQQSITGTREKTGRGFTAADVRQEIETRLARPRRHPDREVQVAFYGGSFTALPDDRQKDLLKAVQPFIQQGRVSLIRLSTRPDYINKHIALFLRSQQVGIVELGIQSMDGRVLKASGRGHTADQVKAAFSHLKEAGIAVGGQLMIGLPAENTNGILAGARRIAGLRPEFVRIYPTLVIKGSRLADRYVTGHYTPVSLNRAVALAARLKEIFDSFGIKTIRMGLQSSTLLEDDLIAGPYHPAFGELVLSRLFFKKTRALLSKRSKGTVREITFAGADQSICRGPGNINITRLEGLGLMRKVKIKFDPRLARGSINLA